MIRLRDYQLDLISRARLSLAKHKRIIIQSATGSGKTVMAARMIELAAQAGRKVLFLVHQRELINQTSGALWHYKIPHGLIVSGRNKTPHNVQVASLLTLVNRLDQYSEFDFIIIDECHRSAANSYQKILDYYPSAYAVGLTATPRRTDGKGLDGTFSDIVPGPSIRFLMDHGHLCDYELYGVPQKIDLSGVKTTAGDYNKGDLERETDKPSVTGDAVEHYKKIAYGKRCVVMCVTIKHAESVAAAYRAAGIPSEAIHGNSAGRDGALERLDSGETLVLTSVNLMIEGTDLPSIAVLQWLRPTKSLVVWLQGIGRGLRPHATKDRLIILDHTGNYATHGLPDMEREWSLEGDKKQGSRKVDPDDIGVQVCGECYFSFKTGVSECPMCGSAVEFKERKLEVVEGELERIKAVEAQELAAVERRKEQGRAREIGDLVRVGVERKMKRPDAWAAAVFAARQGRKPAAADYARAKQALNSGGQS